MPRIENGLKSSNIQMNDHHNGYYNPYYNRLTFGEPRQKIFAVLRFEKHGATDDPGWYIKGVSTDMDDLFKIYKHSVDFPASDGLGWVSNINDVQVVELIPTDSFFKNI